jgi:hypothetical protein
VLERGQREATALGEVGRPGRRRGLGRVIGATSRGKETGGQQDEKNERWRCGAAEHEAEI